MPWELHSFLLNWKNVYSNDPGLRISYSNVISLVQEATRCTPSLSGSPRIRAQWRTGRKAVCSDSKSTGSQQRHCMPQAAALAETDKAADKIYHTPGRICLIADSHAATVALDTLSQAETPFRTDDTCLLSTATCCLPCRDIYWTHTVCAQLLLYKVFSACFVSEVERQGENKHFLWAELIFCYEQNQSCPTILLSPHHA